MMTISLLQADAELSSDITFHAPLTPRGSKPKAIFLTGATGFLGAYLLDELLRQTHDAVVYCLVRSPDNVTALARLKAHLGTYELWREADAERIIPVAGDLSHPGMGLAEADYCRFAEKIDVIFHNGAWINALLSYADLKAVNVEGTREILRFAGAIRTKPLHYISTLALFFSNAHASRVISENDVPILDDGLRGGYKQTKWVAEQMVRNAQSLGLPATIYRPGRIFGHSDTGVNANLQDVLCSVLKGCIHLGKYPDLVVTIDITPIDYVSRGIVFLSLNEAFYGRTFHFCNPEPIPWNALMAILQDLGYPLEGMSYTQWVESLKQYSMEHPKASFFRQLRVLLRSPIYLFSDDKPHAFGTETARMLEVASVTCPPIDRKLMATCFAYFSRCGFLSTDNRKSS